MWLLTDIAEVDKKVLSDKLNYLFDFCLPLEHIRIEDSFPNYWRICGVPVDREAQYIDYLFKWMQSSESNVTAKSRSLFVLFELTKKYPELRNELKLILLDQLDINTEEFKKRANKILAALEG